MQRNKHRSLQLPAVTATPQLVRHKAGVLAAVKALALSCDLCIHSVLDS